MSDSTRMAGRFADSGFCAGCARYASKRRGPSLAIVTVLIVSLMGTMLAHVSNFRAAINRPVTTKFVPGPRRHILAQP